MKRPSWSSLRSIRPAQASTASSSMSAWRKFITRSSAARQSAIEPVLSTNQRSDCCTWLKAPTDHHQLAEASRPEK